MVFPITIIIITIIMIIASIHYTIDITIYSIILNIIRTANCQTKNL